MERMIQQEVEDQYHCMELLNVADNSVSKVDDYLILKKRKKKYIYISNTIYIMSNKYIC